MGQRGKSRYGKGQKLEVKDRENWRLKPLFPCLGLHAKD